MDFSPFSLSIDQEKKVESPFSIDAPYRFGSLSDLYDCSHGQSTHLLILKMSLMMDYSGEPDHSARLVIRGNEPFNAGPTAAAVVEFRNHVSSSRGSGHPGLVETQGSQPSLEGGRQWCVCVGEPDQNSNVPFFRHEVVER
jgi:hypothetical protein